MYAPFVKGGPEGLEESWEAGISTVEGDIYIEKAVRSSHRPAPEDPPLTARPGWTDQRVDGPSDPSSSAGNVMFFISFILRKNFGFEPECTVYYLTFMKSNVQQV